MQITEAEWSQDFEIDLCNLWDMTIEHDVVILLMNYDFLKLATTVLRGPLQEPRFIVSHSLNIFSSFLFFCCCGFVKCGRS